MNNELQNTFNQSTKDVKNLTKIPDDEILLFLYSHYKQATIGDCNINAPNFWNIRDNAKYNAWSSIKGMSKNLAMSLYSKKVNELLKMT
jgi:diazepam-binding inhibitor (GABA receptor modulating acyl-CoA-binding protein)